jgi:hypothetical protein
MDFEAVPIQDFNLSLSTPPRGRPLTLNARAQQIQYLTLTDVTSGDPVTLSVSKPLKLKGVTIGRNWRFSSIDDLDWTSLQYVQYNYSLYPTLKQKSAQVPSQSLAYVNQPLVLAGQTVQLQPRSLTIGASEFTVPTTGPFSLELRIGGSGLCIPSSTGSGCTDDIVERGQLNFAGSAPDPAGKVILDFTSGSSTGRLRLNALSSWTAPANLIIRSGALEFDVTPPGDKYFNYTLEALTNLYLTSTTDAVSPNALFTGVVHAPSLSVSKGAGTRVVFSELHLGSGAYLSGFCGSATLGKTCFGVDITDAYLTNVYLEYGWQLTRHLSVSWLVSMDPAVFQATSVSLDETSSLRFSGEAPAPPASLVGKYNLTAAVIANSDGRRSASQLVTAQNNSIHGEFNRSDTYNPYIRPHICAAPFTNCEAWRNKLESQVTDTNVGSGEIATLSLFCGDYAEDEDSYSVVWPENGDYNDVVIKPTAQCLFAQLTFSGGDPTASHYSESDSDSGISGGTAAAIALGVILFVVILAVVLLIVLGKLAFTHGSDADP